MQLSPGQLSVHPWYNISRLNLMAPMDFLQNAAPFVGAATFCMTKMGILEDDLKNKDESKNEKFNNQRSLLISTHFWGCLSLIHEKKSLRNLLTKPTHFLFIFQHIFTTWTQNIKKHTCNYMKHIGAPRPKIPRGLKLGPRLRNNPVNPIVYFVQLISVWRVDIFSLGNPPYQIEFL